MSAVLIYADTIRSPELRHELPLPLPDAACYAEVDGRRAVLASSFELERIKAAAPGVETFAPDHFGAHELLTGGMTFDEAELEVAVRFCNELGVTSAAVPWSFPVALADHLRTHGIDVFAERQLFDERRRRKNAAEIEGLRRAQRACEAALDVARDMLRRAESNGVLTLGGEPLTSERLKGEIERVFGERGVVGDELIVSHGPQTASPHDMGSGPLRPNEAIILDLFPRDRETGVYSDMTRTYVVGEPSDELREYHRLVKEALERTTAATKPGVNGRDLMQLACDLFHEHGHKTQLHKEPGEVLDSGFVHGLGHGVGLEVHEKPSIGRSGEDLVPGDVITLEPGLYRAGHGGVRLEDILVVTEDGAEVVTDYPYDLEP